MIPICLTIFGGILLVFGIFGLQPVFARIGVVLMVLGFVLTLLTLKRARAGGRRRREPSDRRTSIQWGGKLPR